MAEAFLKWQLFFIIFIVFLAVFINLPPPRLSKRLQEWRYDGKYFNYQGFAVFYKDELGSGDPNSVVVCIHGFPTSSHDWSKIWDSLKTKFGRVIAVDMLGFGFSDKPLDRHYTVKEQATIHELLLKSLAIDSVHILAHDLGDTVALELLARFDDMKLNHQKPTILINSLCLSNGGIFPETNFPRLIQKLMSIPWLSPLLVRLFSYPIFRKSFSEIFGPQTQPSSEDCQDFYSTVRHKDGHMITPKLLHYIIQRTENKERWVGALQKSSIPVHLIYGPSDPVNPPVMLERFRRVITKGTFTELHQSIGHYPQWEDPQGFINGYFSFLIDVQELNN